MNPQGIVLLLCVATAFSCWRVSFLYRSVGAEAGALFVIECGIAFALIVAIRFQFP